MAGLPPAARLRRAADFAALRDARGRWQGCHFTLRWSASSAACARLGLAVSRKVSPRAVERNRIKRTVRESFRQVHAELPTVDLLVIARGSAAASANHLLREDLQRAWSRLRALKQVPAPGTIGG